MPRLLAGPLALMKRTLRPSSSPSAAEVSGAMSNFCRPRISSPTLIGPMPSPMGAPLSRASMKPRKALPCLRKSGMTA